jgi:hypothetical protein
MKESEIFEKVYAYFKLQYGNPRLLPFIIGSLNELAVNAEWATIENHLKDESDPLFLLNRALLAAHCSRQEGFDKSKADELFSNWADALCQLLLKIVQTTKDYDYLVQQVLNYEDFLFYEMRWSLNRKQIACQIYDLRGIDFFLIHYMENPTTAFKDDALWKSAELISDFLDELGRHEESSYVKEELKQRKEKIKEIITEYSAVDTQSINEALENIRLIGERFWVEYLTPYVWTNLSEVSRRELLDAFVAEIMLKKGILKGWSQVVLSLCKVIEREMGGILFTKWIEVIRRAEFSIPNDISKRSLKRIQSREFTFNTLKSCAKDPAHPPTLGQLVFVAKFWSDDTMNLCTPLFLTINDIVKSYDPDFSEKMTALSFLLEEKHPYKDEQPTLVELRNASAHPGHENDFTWGEHISWLKEFLGKPPREALKLIITLKEVLNKTVM